MSTLDQVIVIPRALRADQRGWLVKVIDGTEPLLPLAMGEIYVTLTHPGQSRGNHYHLQASEWFSVVAGEADVILVDPVSGEKRSYVLSAESPATIFVPSGVGHMFTNPAAATEPMVLIAYADRRYDPSDTIPLDGTP